MIDDIAYRVVRIVNRIVRTFFYIDRFDGRNDRVYRHVRELEERLYELSEEVKSDVFKDKLELVENEVEKYVENNLERIIGEKFTEMNSDEVAIKNEIRSIADKSVREFMSGDEISKIATQLAEQEVLKRKLTEEKRLNSMLDAQMQNAGTLKTVMINLFVVVNLGILAFYVFGNVGLIPEKAIYGVIGLYVSLATFIVYIYRASNSRTSALLAIREDSKKFYDVLQYLKSFKGNGELTEHDIDLIRMIMTNRAEREKATNHPYEMIFKGVSDSNIQFKGGKMSFEKKASKDS